MTGGNLLGCQGMPLWKKAFKLDLKDNKEGTMGDSGEARAFQVEGIYPVICVHQSSKSFLN